MLELIKKILWLIAILFLFGGAIYYSFKLKFVQFNLLSILKKFFNSNSNGSSAFESLSISLAARIGVGSLSGIALAIFFGGPGTIFWIWIIGIIMSINVFCETYLGVKYNQSDGEKYKGGPAFYISRGLGKQKLAKLYALFVIIAYIGGFLIIQSNTIAISLIEVFDTNLLTISIFLVTITAFSIVGGLNSITKVTTKLIPMMGISYLILGLIIIILNIEKIPFVLYSIFNGAWNIKSLGLGFFSVLIIGVQRGVFCTESGLGTGSIASSSSSPKNNIDFSVGQIIGIFFTVFIVCTSTALIILTSDYTSSSIIVNNGIELTQYALEYHLGEIGKIILIILVFFLAYSTIIAGYYYGESNLKFLIKDYKKVHINFLKIITLLLLLVGGVINPLYLWNIVDILISILAIINMYAIIMFRKEIIFDYKKNIRK